jgi:dienelactone hydrolase
MPFLCATARVMCLLVLLASGFARAQVIEIAPTYKGMFSSPDPTKTLLMQAPDARATLVFIPGGEGRLDLTPERLPRILAFHYNVMLRSLSDPALTSGRFNVVIFDSPKPLPTPNHWSPQRTGADHLSRVEDVLRYYKERLGKPVWLMGHSMGSISVTEAHKRLLDEKSADLVAGLIVSAGQNGTSLDWDRTKLPVLVLHHENDPCVGNTVAHARRVVSKLRDAGNASAELVLVNGGAAGADPCRSGYHMYVDIEQEVAKVLDAFMTRYAEPASGPAAPREQARR